MFACVQSRRIHLIALACVAFALSTRAIAEEPAKPKKEEAPKSKSVTMLLTGGPELFEVDIPRDESTVGKEKSPPKTWVWQARGSKDIPDRLHGAFMTITECKPVDHGRRLIITAKEGGAALINRATRKTEFVTLVTGGRVYSGDLLPENRLVFAVGGDKGGHLVVYDLDGVGTPLIRLEFESAHGVHFDAKTETVWATGYSDLRSYQLNDWKTKTPKLKLLLNIPLPKKDGHDVAPVPGKPELIVTTEAGVYLFDTDKNRFRGHPVLGTYEHVKSVSVHPETGRWAYVLPEGDNWWTNRVRFVGDRNDLIFPNTKIYKARWLITE